MLTTTSRSRTPNKRFGEVCARGKFCGNLKVCRPSELLRSPARTPSRQPLAVMRRQSENEKKLLT